MEQDKKPIDKKYSSFYCVDDNFNLIPEAYFTGEFNRDVYICPFCKKEKSGFDLFKQGVQ